MEGETGHPHAGGDTDRRWPRDPATSSGAAAPTRSPESRTRPRPPQSVAIPESMKKEDLNVLHSYQSEKSSETAPVPPEQQLSQTETQVGQQQVTSPETTEESVTEPLKKEALNVLDSCQSEKSSETAPVPACFAKMPPEYREKLMKHNQERKALMAAFLLAAPRANKRSQKPPGQPQNELGHKRPETSGIPAAIPDAKRLEMMSIRRDRQLDEDIQDALLHVQHLLTRNETAKISEETLRLLQDVSGCKFQVLEDQGGGDKDKKADHSANSPLTVAEEMAQELESFASYSRHWKRTWGKTCGTFTQATLLSSMQFTHYTPGRMSPIDCSTVQTLQIISIQLTQLADDLEFPLSVYGVVAVRDMVDRNRNVLFFRGSHEAQEVKHNDNFLHLVGPSRAIVLMHEVWIEIELRVKGAAADSRIKPLISCARRYDGGEPGVSTICFKNALCTLELCLQPVECTVQATILGVHVAKDDGSWPFQHGGLVACTPHSGTLRITDCEVTCEIDPSSTQIVLNESKDDAMPEVRSGYLLLRRQVVSVNFDGRLDVVIKAYSKSGAIVAETRVFFEPKMSHISLKKFALGDKTQGAVTVAWSRVAGSLTEASVELNGRVIT